ncbi:hypothetical protein ACFOVU_07780 [Nocardiopsis sediminis]|uniref:RanBP2-type domain-containing protein n=1 Tax=Nocardiopsis sediminis TaxID=1778267 RepID=A0ABV8FKA1_9ACTN
MTAEKRKRVPDRTWWCSSCDTYNNVGVANCMVCGTPDRSTRDADTDIDDEPVPEAPEPPGPFPSAPAAAKRPPDDPPAQTGDPLTSTGGMPTIWRCLLCDSDSGSGDVLICPTCDAAGGEPPPRVRDDAPAADPLTTTGDLLIDPPQPTRWEPPEPQTPAEPWTPSQPWPAATAGRTGADRAFPWDRTEDEPAEAGGWVPPGPRAAREPLTPAEPWMPAGAWASAMDDGPRDPFDRAQAAERTARDGTAADDGDSTGDFWSDSDPWGDQEDEQAGAPWAAADDGPRADRRGPGTPTGARRPAAGARTGVGTGTGARAGAGAGPGEGAGAKAASGRGRTARPARGPGAATDSGPITAPILTPPPWRPPSVTRARGSDPAAVVRPAAPRPGARNDPQEALNRAKPAVLAAALFLGGSFLLYSCVAAVRDDTPPPPNSVLPPNGAGSLPGLPDGRCPQRLAERLPEPEASLVEAFQTTDKQITICQTESGLLYYFGEFTDREDPGVMVPAEQTAEGYEASNEEYVYEISDSEVTVSRNGDPIAREDLLPLPNPA